MLRASGLDDLSRWHETWRAAPPDVAARWFAATRSPALKTTASTQAWDLSGLVEWALATAAAPKDHPALPAVRAWLGDRLPNPALPQTWVAAIDAAGRLPNAEAWRPLVSTVERLGWQDWAGLGAEYTAGDWTLPNNGKPKNAGDCINHVRAVLNLGRQPFRLGAVIAALRQHGYRAAAEALHDRTRAWSLPEVEGEGRPRLRM